MHVDWVGRRTFCSVDGCPLFPPKADIGTQPRNVCFVPKADILSRRHAKFERCCYKTGMKRLTAIVALTLVPFAAAAQSTGVLATKRPITWGMIFALLFL